MSDESAPPRRADPFPPPWPPGRVRALAMHIIENEVLNGEVIRLDAIRMGAK